MAEYIKVHNSSLSFLGPNLTQGMVRIIESAAMQHSTTKFVSIHILYSVQYIHYTVQYYNILCTTCTTTIYKKKKNYRESATRKKKVKLFFPVNLQTF